MLQKNENGEVIGYELSKWDKLKLVVSYIFILCSVAYTAYKVTEKICEFIADKVWKAKERFQVPHYDDNSAEDIAD